MDPKKIISPISAMGISLKMLAVGLLVLVVLALLIGLFIVWRKRSPAPPESAQLPAEARAGEPVAPDTLSRAWQRFLRSLPAVHRRSILNFEHFVIFGAVSSGKSRLIDTYSDWRKQTKQLLDTDYSRSVDPDLQVHLASWSVITEVPARLLLDYSEACTKAFERLWRPIYRRRSPSVVVVIDATVARDAPAEELKDLAERVRGKVNILSKVRGRPIDVRIALTHLDAIPGYKEFAKFCRDQRIALHADYDPSESTSSTVDQLTGWTTAMRGHFARALVTLPSSDVQRVISFVRGAPGVIPGLSAFLTALFEPDALTATPTSSGIYLCDDSIGLPNPLRSASEAGPGPDPRVRARLLVAAVASAIVTFLTASMLEQRADGEAARAALRGYKPATVGQASEHVVRATIRRFAMHEEGIFGYPDFFKAKRQAMSDEMSVAMRDSGLIPRLQTVMRQGSIDPTKMRIPWRRGAFYLALIHSNRRDTMHIAAPGSIDAYAEQMELPQDFIVDYLDMTRNVYRAVVPFEGSAAAFGLASSLTKWVEFLADVQAKERDGMMRPSELADLQEKATKLADTFERFRHDARIVTIMSTLDEAVNEAQIGDPNAAPSQLLPIYRIKYEHFLTKELSTAPLAHEQELKEIIAAVRYATIDVPTVSLLSELNDRLVTMIPPAGDPAAQAIAFKLESTEVRFSKLGWEQTLRASRAAALASAYLNASSSSRSVFFNAEIDREFRGISWNPNNDGLSLFVGKATIDARYTRAAYDKRVREAVERFYDTVSKLLLPADEKEALAALVRDQVKSYASEYAGQLGRFYRSFAVRARSEEELRVVVAQMAAESSAFADFANTVAQQIGTSPTHPWLAPMADELGAFGGLARVLEGSGGAPEIAKYKEILRQLLADLGPPSEKEAAAPSDGASTLEASLSRSGALTLKTVRGDRGAYPTIVAEWLGSVKLSDWQRRPFEIPTQELTQIGLVNLDQEVRRGWNRELMMSLDRVASKYPFDPASKDDVKPKDLEAVFSPEKGLFFDAFRRYLEPVAEIREGKPFREIPGLRGRIGSAERMFAVVNAAATVTTKLFDTSGAPRSIDVRLGTVPFDHGTDPSAAMTLAFLTIGDASIFNFNQKASVSTIKLDWTREQPSQVGVQLTDLDTKENKVPTPVSVDPGYWSFFRLLAMGQSIPLRSEPGATYTWTFGTDKLAPRVRFAVYGEPLDAFTALGARVREFRGQRGGGSP